MATQLQNATLTVTVTENITLNGEAINSSNVLSVSNINEVDKRIMTIPITEVVVMGFGTAVAAGTLIAANVKYLRIVNKDDTYTVRIRIKKAGAETFDIKLDPGKSFILGNVSESVAATAAAFSAFVVADSVCAQADTAPVDIEYFIAST